MNANSLSEWFAMGGHGIYVWPSLLLCLIVVLLEYLILKQARQHAIARIRKLHSTPPRKTHP